MPHGRLTVDVGVVNRDQVERMSDRWLDIPDDPHDDACTEACDGGECADRAYDIEVANAEARAEAIMEGDW